MYTVNEKQTKAPNRLFMGLAIGLAATLCAFEYGKPKEVPLKGWTLDYTDEIDEDLAPVRIEEKQKNEVMKKQTVVQTQVLNFKNDVEVVVDSMDVIVDADTLDKSIFPLVFVPEPDPEAPWIFVEQFPQFPGGELALYQFLSKYTRYPEKAKENGIQGIVYVKFVVAKDGSLTRVEIERGAHPWLDREAMEVVRKMPNWIPGKQQGIAVPVSMKMPINFKLIN
jgi:protein TonB